MLFIYLFIRVCKAKTSLTHGWPASFKFWGGHVEVENKKHEHVIITRYNMDFATGKMMIMRKSVLYNCLIYLVDCC